MAVIDILHPLAPTAALVKAGLIQNSLPNHERPIWDRRSSVAPVLRSPVHSTQTRTEAQADRLRKPADAVARLIESATKKASRVGWAWFRPFCRRQACLGFDGLEGTICDQAV